MRLKLAIAALLVCGVGFVMHERKSALESHLGCPETPMTAEQLRRKFDKLTQGASAKLRQTLFDDLMRIEQLPSLDQLALS